MLHQLNQLDHVNIIKQKSSLTSHKELRKLVIQYLIDNPYVPEITSAQQILMRNFVNDNNFDEYLNLMALPTTFGDNITIQALAETFSIQILVVSTLCSDGTRLIMPRSCPVEKYSDAMPLIIFGHYAETGDHIKEHYVALQTESENAFSNIISKFIVVKLTTSVDDSHIKLESSESLKADDAIAVADANESQSLQSQIASAIASPKRKRTFQKHWITKYPRLHYEEATDTVTCSICREAEESCSCFLQTRMNHLFQLASGIRQLRDLIFTNNHLFILKLY